LGARQAEGLGGAGTEATARHSQSDRVHTVFFPPPLFFPLQIFFCGSDQNFLDIQRMFDKPHCIRLFFGIFVSLFNFIFCHFFFSPIFLLKLWLILLAFITGNSSLEPLLEGLFAQIHIDLS